MALKWQTLESRASDIKPPVLWIHGVSDQINLPSWTENIMRVATSSTATVSDFINTVIFTPSANGSINVLQMKFAQNIRVGVFMDDGAPFAVQETLNWLNNMHPTDDEAKEKVETGAIPDDSGLFGVFSLP
jgi:hypothetical protein